MSKKKIFGFSPNECYALVIGINYVNTPEIKVALKEGFMLEIVKRPLFERIKIAVLSKKPKSFFYKSILITLDGQKASYFGFGKDLNKEKELLEDLTDEVNQSLNRHLMTKEMQAKITDYLKENYGDKFGFDIDVQKGDK